MVQIDEGVVDSQVRRTMARFSTGEPVDGTAELDDNLIVNITVRHNDKVVATYPEKSMRLAPKLSMADAVVENFGELLVGTRKVRKSPPKFKLVKSRSIRPMPGGIGCRV